MTTSQPLHARCACGEIHLEIDPPLLFVSHCHCETCRRVHSAPFVTWTAVGASQLRVCGSLRGWSSSPGVTREFCGTCGSPMLFTMEGLDRIYIPVASLMSELPIPVESHVSIEERPGWVAGLEGLPCFLGKTAVPGSWSAGRPGTATKVR